MHLHKLESLCYKEGRGAGVVPLSEPGFAGLEDLQDKRRGFWWCIQVYACSFCLNRGGRGGASAQTGKFVLQEEAQTGKLVLQRRGHGSGCAVCGIRLIV